MKTNPILEELYAAREKLLAEANGDVHEYLQGVRQREQASGRLLSPEDLQLLRAPVVETSHGVAPKSE